MNKQSHIHKKADSSASNPVRSQLQSRPFIAQAKAQPQKALTQTQTENQEFQQQKFEATKLKLQAKYGTITPEGQERLTVLQAKMSGSLHSRLQQASSNGSNFANIPISRPDAPSQLAVQTKLTIGEPGDKYEQEADRVAAQVVNQINAPVSGQVGQNVQREEISEEEKELHMKPMLQLRSAKVGMSAAPEVEASIKQARGGGQSMADNIRKPMEQFIGADFSRVKVHTDAQSDQLNRSLQARAFTTGHNVFFRQGEYNPGSRRGQELIAHELTHVVQQGGGAVQRTNDTKATNNKYYPTQQGSGQQLQRKSVPGCAGYGNFTDLGNGLFATPQPTNANEVAGLINTIRQAAATAKEPRNVKILTGTHGDPSGHLVGEQNFYQEDLVHEGYGGSGWINVLNVQKPRDKEQVTSWKRPGSSVVILAWCYSSVSENNWSAVHCYRTNANYQANQQVW